MVRWVAILGLGSNLDTVLLNCSLDQTKHELEGVAVSYGMSSSVVLYWLSLKSCLIP